MAITFIGKPEERKMFGINKGEILKILQNNYCNFTEVGSFHLTVC